jgi:hypothetical protein
MKYRAAVAAFLLLVPALVHADDSAAGGPPAPPPLPSVDVAPAAGAGYAIERLFGKKCDHASLLEDGGVAFAASGKVYLVGADGGPERLLGRAPGDVVSVVGSEASRLLVAGRKGVSKLEDSKLEDTPMSRSLDTKALHTMITVPGPSGSDFWISDARGLHRWRSSLLQRIAIDEFPTADAHLFLGTPIDNAPALWIVARNALYALLLYPDDSLGVRIELLDRPVASAALDGAGTMWAVSEGRLLRRIQGGRWEHLRLDSAVQRVAATPDHESVWIQSDSGLLHAYKGVFSVVRDAPKGDLRASDRQGRALLAGGAGVYRVAAAAETASP